MFTLELVLKKTHYHCARILLRTRYYWLKRVLEENKLLARLLKVLRSNPRIIETGYALETGGVFRLRSREDLERMVDSLTRDLGIDEEARGVLLEYLVTVGWSNAVQTLLSKYPLAIAYGVTHGCLENKLCVIEPRIEVENHSVSRILEGKRLLPYRMFDLALAEQATIHFVELKWRVKREPLPGTTALAYLASFAEKLASTHIHIGRALARAGYNVAYSLVIVLPPESGIEDSTRTHMEKVTNAFANLVGANVTLQILSFQELVSKLDSKAVEAETVKTLTERAEV